MIYTLKRIYNIIHISSAQFTNLPISLMSRLSPALATSVLLYCYLLLLQVQAINFWRHLHCVLFSYDLWSGELDKTPRNRGKRIFMPPLPLSFSLSFN